MNSGVRSRDHRRRHQRLRHRARCRRPRPVVFSCASRTILASATSSWSTKLIHGGLRYLEHYDFRLVREALMEREVLLGDRAAHHPPDPLRAAASSRPASAPGCCGSACSLYDHLGGRKLLPPTRTLDLRTDVAGEPLQPGRFTMASNTPIARSTTRAWSSSTRSTPPTRGASIRPRTRCVVARSGKARWKLTLEDTATGERRIDHRARPGQRRRALGRRSPRPCRRQRPRQCAAGEGHPHRGADGSSSTTAPISSRTPTAASSSPFPIRTTSP